MFILADYLYWNRISSVVTEGPQEFVDISFDFTSILYGQSTQSPRYLAIVMTCLPFPTHDNMNNFRWAKCTSKASSEDKGFAYAVGRLYVAKNFDEDTKLDASALVDDLRASFKELVSESVWMDADTQVLAQEKADQIIQLVGYPDWPNDDAELDRRYKDVRTHRRSLTKMSS